MANTANLLRLPPELMLRISSHLTTHELACFRLTCKQVETNLFESFAREFFTKRQFMLEEVSIQALVGIANHKTLAPYLREVIIHTEKLLDTSLAREPYGYDVLKSDTFLTTGRAHVLLARAFSKLPNLRTIGIRDYDARGRWRDGEKALWRSYGWSQNPSEKRFRPRMEPEAILPLLLYSLGEASTGPQRIEMFLRHHPVPDRSFDLSPSFMQSGAVPILSSLRALLLSLDGRMNRYDDMINGSGPSNNGESGFGCLRCFLHYTHLLEHIRLNFKHSGMPERHTDAFLAWLGTSPGPDVNMTPAPVKLDHLTTLELGIVDIAPHTLLDLVSKFTKLEAVSLWKIGLQPIRASSEDREYNSRCVWAYYLRKIGEALPAPENVKTFMIGWITEILAPDMVQNPVRFAGDVNVDSNGVPAFEDVGDVVKYRKRVGSSVRTWLDELAEKAFMQTPIEAFGSSDDEGDEDSQDDGTPNDGSEDDGNDDDGNGDDGNGDDGSEDDELLDVYDAANREAVED